MVELASLRLTDFRCFAAAEFTLQPGINVITGQNGSGKTSVLEAVYALLRHGSFRSNSADDQIRWGQSETTVTAELVEPTLAADHPRVIGVQRSSRGYRGRLAGEPVERRSQLVREFPMTVITPATTTLVSGGPAERRRFLDQLMFHVEHSFVDCWRSYRAVLNQRNALLRARRYQGLEQWTAMLVEHGERLHEYRKDAVEQLQGPLQAMLEVQLKQPWQVQVDYRSGWSEVSFAQGLHDSADLERRRMTTVRGPHRAELRFTVNGHSVAEALSRGQQRILACALLLTQLQLVNAASGRKSLVLLDDITAELDHNNALRMVELCASFGGQLLVTALSARPLGDALNAAAVFHVEQCSTRSQTP